MQTNRTRAVKELIRAGDELMLAIKLCAPSWMPHPTQHMDSAMAWWKEAKEKFLALR